jgi:hypothetical protein
MKTPILVCSLSLIAACALQAGLYSFNYTVGTAIPDGSASGLGNQQTVSGLPATIQDVTVGINISGGYNGDIYGYIRHNDTLVMLLDRVGTTSGNHFGYDDAGVDVTLSDHATQVPTIHLYQDAAYSINGNGQLTGTWRPDGGSFISFQNATPNGTWTVFFADLSAGGGQSMLEGWSLNITVVPEPVNVALGIFGGVFVAAILLRSSRVRQWVQRRRDAVVEWINAV